MTTISLLAYAEGHPETGHHDAPKIPLTISVDLTEKQVLDYRAGLTGYGAVQILDGITATDFGQQYELVGWKLSTITIVGATTPPTPAPIGLQLTIQKTVATRSVEHVDMAKHWTAFGAYVTAWLEDPDDCVLENRFSYVLEMYFSSIAGPGVTSLVVKA